MPKQAASSKAKDSSNQPDANEKQLRKRERRLQERLQAAQKAYERAQERLKSAEARAQKRSARLERAVERLAEVRQQLNPAEASPAQEAAPASQVDNSASEQEAAPPASDEA